MICREKIIFDQIQDGRHAATFDINMFNNWKFDSNLKPLLTNKMCWFQGGGCSEKNQLDQIVNGWIAAIINFKMRNTWKTVLGG